MANEEFNTDMGIDLAIGKINDAVEIETLETEVKETEVALEAAIAAKLAAEAALESATKGTQFVVFAVNAATAIDSDLLASGAIASLSIASTFLTQVENWVGVVTGLGNAGLNLLRFTTEEPHTVEEVKALLQKAIDETEGVDPTQIHIGSVELLHPIPII